MTQPCPNPRARPEKLIAVKICQLSEGPLSQLSVGAPSRSVLVQKDTCISKGWIASYEAICDCTTLLQDAGCGQLVDWQQ